MKWKDLSLKERKQIYDSVRVNNPGATYFDIKQQFDSIPAYQDGKGKTINKADLPPEYRIGTPEYFERQRKISGAAMDAVLNLIPWGVGKGIKKLKSKVGRIVEGTEVDGVSVHSFAPTQTKKKTKKKTEEDYDSEFSYDLYRNKNEYIDRLNKLIPMEILMPLGGAGFVGHELNKE